MSKSKKQLLLELLELEEDDLGDIGESNKPSLTKVNDLIKNTDCIDGNESATCPEKPRKVLTEKQLEALKKGQQKRDENRERMRAEKKQKEEEEKKILEEKLVKKAIAVKKKQIKKQAVLDEISDDETPLEKIKVIAENIKEGTKGSLPNPPLPKGSFIKFF
jgi:hypothetical protein